MLDFETDSGKRNGVRSSSSLSQAPMEAKKYMQCLDSLASDLSNSWFLRKESD